MVLVMKILEKTPVFFSHIKDVTSDIAWILVYFLIIVATIWLFLYSFNFVHKPPFGIEPTKMLEKYLEKI